MRCYSPNPSFVGLFFPLLALFLVKLSWQTMLILIHAHRTTSISISLPWLRCHYRARCTDCVVGDVVFVWHAKQFPSADQQCLQDVRCHCSGLAGVQQDWVKQGAHKSNLWAKREMLSVMRWFSVSLVLLLFVQFWTVIQAWNLGLWRLRPYIKNC